MSPPHESGINHTENKSPWQDIKMKQALSASEVFAISNTLRQSPVPGWVQQLKIFVFRNITLEPILPFIIVEGAKREFSLEFEISGYGDTETLLLDPQSRIYNFQPDIAWLWFELSEFYPTLWRDFSLLDEKAVNSIINGIVNQLKSLITKIRDNFSCDVILQGFRKPPQANLGLFDSFAKPGQNQTITAINNALLDICKSEANCYYFNYDYLVSLFGYSRWTDTRLWFTSLIPVSSVNFPWFAEHFIALLGALKGKRKKCIVVDLDNTLWGGVIGEDGLEGIALGQNAPGKLYLEFQHFLLSYYHQGVLLAICSKNNESDALDVFHNHPDMVLHWEHFSAHRINWIDKRTNLRDIAKELNIGLDSFVFLDDSAVERELIKQSLPEVTVPDFPATPYLLPKFMLRFHWFDTLTLTNEDKQRSKLYIQQRERAEFKSSVESLEEFYHSLQMKLQIESLNDFNKSRIIQLTQKTNQFNLTTRRYSEEQVMGFISRGGYVWCCRVIDRFGDNGIAAVCIVSLHDAKAEIDTFLLSCRVIGRTVETAFLNWIMNFLYNQGISKLNGSYLPTQKNALVKDFYPNHGLKKEKDLDDEGSVWTTQLDGVRIIPDWFELVLKGDDCND